MYSRVAPCLSRAAVRVGAAWTLNPQYSQRLSFRRLRITAPELGAKGHNTDGFDPWACQHAEFIDSYYSAGDDCGALPMHCPRDSETEAKTGSCIIHSTTHRQTATDQHQSYSSCVCCLVASRPWSESSCGMTHSEIQFLELCLSFTRADKPGLFTTIEPPIMTGKEWQGYERNQPLALRCGDLPTFLI
jgi:hypothetical protein